MTCDWDPVDDPFPGERDSVCPLGTGRTATDGPAAVGLGDVGRLVSLVSGHRAGGAAWVDRLFLSRSAPPGSTEPGLLVSPADGKVVEITRLEHDEFIGGPAVRIGIFLSIFNVHINRAPAGSRVIRLRYSPGVFLNAMNPESSLRNENLWIGLEEEAPLPAAGRSADRRLDRAANRLRSAAAAKRWTRGQKFGMIKLGSRTELIFLAEAGLEMRIGQNVWRQRRLARYQRRPRRHK